MPSLIWSAAYLFLLCELVVVAILVVPVPIKIRNAICRQVFQLDLGDRLKKPILFIGIALAFGFVDSYSKHQYVMDMINDDHRTEIEHGHHVPHMHMHHEKEKKYKAERNMYLTGFALTLLFVIGRITQLMQEHVELENELHPETATKKKGEEEAPKKPADKKKD